MNIITAFEVQIAGPAENNYPASVICKHIKSSELVLFDSCFLGCDFYKLLINALTPVPTINYDLEQSYSLGQVVNYEGCVLKSLVNNNTIHPDNDDSSNPSWGFNPKFTDDTYNELWEDYMKGWLSFEIVLTSMKYNTFKMGAKGTTRVKDDDTGLETVDYKTFQSVKTEIRKDADTRLELMYKYIMKNDKFKFLNPSGGECGEMTCIPKKKRRRFYFAG